MEGKIYNTSFIVYYECLGKEKVKTRVGDFECYSSDKFSIEYFSPSVKNEVLSISYKNGEVVSRKELIETSYRKNHGIPSFTFQMLIFSFVCILLLIKILRKS